MPDGTKLKLDSSLGPDVDSEYPLGTFIQDYEFVNGLGDLGIYLFFFKSYKYFYLIFYSHPLDAYNGRWTITPEYPNGTYGKSFIIIFKNYIFKLKFFLIKHISLLRQKMARAFTHMLLAHFIMVKFWASIGARKRA